MHSAADTADITISGLPRPGGVSPAQIVAQQLDPKALPQAHPHRLLVPLSACLPLFLPVGHVQPAAAIIEVVSAAHMTDHLIASPHSLGISFATERASCALLHHEAANKL